MGLDRKSEIILPAHTPWLNNAKVKRICDIIEHAGYEVFFVGGCVRNAILGAPAGDIDLSTNARPGIVMQLAQEAGLNAIPTGIEYGTVTIIVAGSSYEITTFRRDIATDGRRAVVAFSEDIQEDARRRDFTMNALYARSNGQIVDPLSGLQDVLDRRIRFIEDAGKRIEEDYLRVLRFFRFSAWYGDGEYGFDPEALHAIAGHLEGLRQLSAERVGREMIKLLTAPDPAPALAVMRQTGVLHALFEGADERWMGPLIHVEHMLDLPAEPIRRLAILGGGGLDQTLRLSKKQARKLKLFHEEMYSMRTEGELGYRYGLEDAISIIALRCAVSSFEPSHTVIRQIEKGVKAGFPVTSADLRDHFQGRALGQKLKDLEAEWIASGFTKTKSQLLQEL